MRSFMPCADLRGQGFLLDFIAYAPESVGAALYGGPWPSGGAPLEKRGDPPYAALKHCIPPRGLSVSHPAKNTKGVLDRFIACATHFLAGWDIARHLSAEFVELCASAEKTNLPFPKIKSVSYTNCEA